MNRHFTPSPSACAGFPAAAACPPRRSHLDRLARTALWALVGAMGALGSTAHADDTVYRWVDDTGHIHYGDRVPEAYRAKAQALPAAPEPSAQDQQAAQQRAARAEAHAQSAAASAAEAARSARAQGWAASPLPITKRPSHVPDEHTDCDSWLMLYWESENCFGPYHTAKGGLKAEAYMHCNEVPAPPLRCQAPWFQWGRR